MMDANRAKMLNQLVRITVEKIHKYGDLVENLAKTDPSTWNEGEGYMARGILLAMCSITHANMVRYLDESGKGEFTTFDKEQNVIARHKLVSMLTENTNLIADIVARDKGAEFKPQEILFMQLATAGMMMLVEDGSLRAE